VSQSIAQEWLAKVGWWTIPERHTRNLPQMQTQQQTPY
jgi:hypothetical protein